MPWFRRGMWNAVNAECSREGASRNPDFRYGEDNIFTLPEFSDYDGIVVDLVNMETSTREVVLKQIRERQLQSAMGIMY